MLGMQALWSRATRGASRSASALALRRRASTRQGFGSWHSEDIESLVRLPDSAYEPPALHSEVAAKSIPESLLSDISSMQFGEEILWIRPSRF